jgi:proteasome lid subunit RPN8/RPN11
MLTITNDVLQNMIEHAKNGLPNEACGYLAQKDNVVVRFYPLRNIDQSPEHFSFDPAEQFAVMRSMRVDGVASAAVFHSHPSTPARPSVEDIRLLRDPTLRYVIMSLAEKEPVLKCFWIKDSQATQEEVKILEQETPKEG